MKSFTRSALSFRPFLPPFLLACCLILPASPAAAGKGTPEPEAHQESSEQTLLTELAQRTRDRALFAAKIAPELSRILRDSRYGDPEAFVDSFWVLRAMPETQKEWLHELSRPDLAGKAKQQLLHEFNLFMEDTSYRAEWIMRGEPVRKSGNLWTWIRRAILKTDGPRDGRERFALEARYQRTAQRLEEAKAREKAFAEVLALSDACRKAGLDPREGELYAQYILQLKDRPDDLELAVDIIKKTALPPRAIHSLLAALVENPAKARKDIADLEKAVKTFRQK